MCCFRIGISLGLKTFQAIATIPNNFQYAALSFLYGSDTPTPHARTTPIEVSFGLRPLTLPVEIPVKLVPTLAFETPL